MEDKSLAEDFREFMEELDRQHPLDDPEEPEIVLAILREVLKCRVPRKAVL